MVKIYNTSENIYHLKNGFVLKPKQFTMIDQEEALHLDQSFPNCFSITGLTSSSNQITGDLTQEIQELKNELNKLKSEKENSDELDVVRNQLKELGISYSPKSKIDVLKEKLNQALAEKEIA